MKPRIRVGCAPYGWWAMCHEHNVLYAGRSWPDALAAANAHARTHRRTDIASFLALRDDHPHDRRWDTPLSHDLPEPPC